MTLEIRPTEEPNHFDLYENDDKIGELHPEQLDEEGIALGETAWWNVIVWSLMGTGKEWSLTIENPDEAKEAAHGFYQEFVAERRRLNEPGPGPRVRVISTPTGGQKKR